MEALTHTIGVNVNISRTITPAKYDAETAYSTTENKRMITITAELVYINNNSLNDDWSNLIINSYS